VLACAGVGAWTEIYRLFRLIRRYSHEIIIILLPSQQASLPLTMSISPGIAPLPLGCSVWWKDGVYCHICLLGTHLIRPISHIRRTRTQLSIIVDPAVSLRLSQQNCRHGTYWSGVLQWRILFRAGSRAHGRMMGTETIISLSAAGRSPVPARIRTHAYGLLEGLQFCSKLSSGVDKEQSCVQGEQGCHVHYCTCS
jgi:hypothetical protein